MYAAVYEPVDPEILPPDESRDLTIESNNGVKIRLHKGLLRLRSLEREPSWLEKEQIFVPDYNINHFEAFHEACYLNLMDFKFPEKTSALWEILQLTTIDEAVEISKAIPYWTCGPLNFNKEVQELRQCSLLNKRRFTRITSETIPPFIPPFLKWEAAQLYLKPFYQPPPLIESLILEEASPCPRWDHKLEDYSNKSDEIEIWAATINWRKAFFSGFEIFSNLPYLKWSHIDPRVTYSLGFAVRAHSRDELMITRSLTAAMELTAHMTGTIIFHESPRGNRSIRILHITGTTPKISSAIRELSAVGREAWDTPYGPYGSMSPDPDLYFPYEFVSTGYLDNSTHLFPPQCRNRHHPWNATKLAHINLECYLTPTGAQRDYEPRPLNKFPRQVMAVTNYVRARAEWATNYGVENYMEADDPLRLLIHSEMATQQLVLDYPSSFGDYLKRKQLHCADEFILNHRPQEDIEEFLKSHPTQRGVYRGVNFIQCECTKENPCACGRCAGPYNRVRDLTCRRRAPEKLAQLPALRPVETSSSSTTANESPNQMYVGSISRGRSGRAARGLGRATRPVNPPTDKPSDQPPIPSTSWAGATFPVPPSTRYLVRGVWQASTKPLVHYYEKGGISIYVSPHKEDLTVKVCRFIPLSEDKAVQTDEQQAEQLPTTPPPSNPVEDELQDSPGSSDYLSASSRAHSPGLAPTVREIVREFFKEKEEEAGGEEPETLRRSAPAPTDNDQSPPPPPPRQAPMEILQNDAIQGIVNTMMQDLMRAYVEFVEETTPSAPADPPPPPTDPQ